MAYIDTPAELRAASTHTILDSVAAGAITVEEAAVEVARRIAATGRLASRLGRMHPLATTPDAPVARCSCCGEPTSIAVCGAGWYLCDNCEGTDDAVSAGYRHSYARLEDLPYTYYPHGEFCRDDAVEYDTAYGAMDALESGDPGGLISDASGHFVANWRPDGGVDVSDSFRARAATP